MGKNVVINSGVKRQTATILVLTISLLAFTRNALNQMPKKGELEYKMAVSELETILDKSNSIRDARKFVAVRARAANVLWVRNPEEARQIFVKLWAKISDEREDKSFDKESSRIDLLEQLFPRDRSLALKLIASLKEQKDASSLMDTLKGTNPETQRLAFLAYRLSEENPGLAATVLGDSLANNTAPSLPLVLNRIREKNPVLANYVTLQALERFPSQSPSVALSGLVNIIAYLFPFTPSFSTSIDTVETDENLRQAFMHYGLGVLKRSLNETDEYLIKEKNFTPEALKLRKFNQTVVAGVLAAMAPRYSFQNYVELSVISTSLMQVISPQFAGLVSMQVAAVKAILGRVEEAEISEAEIISALAKEDFAKAELLIGEIKDEERKKSWLGILYRSQARNQIQRGEPLLALGTAQKIDNVTMALPILISIAKLANKKRDESLSITTYQEIERLAGKMKKGMNAKTMFTVSAEMAYLMKSQCLISLQKSVETINGLYEIKSEQTKPLTYRGETYWEDPDNFVTSSALSKAFSVLGEVDLQETLLIASRFRDNSLQMVARMATVERIIRKGPPPSEIKDKTERQKHN